MDRASEITEALKALEALRTRWSSPKADPESKTRDANLALVVIERLNTLLADWAIQWSADQVLTDRSSKLPEAARQRAALIRTVFAAGVVAHDQRGSLIKALQALDLGQVHKLLAPTTGHRVSSAVVDVRILAIQHVYYRAGGGMRIGEAREQIAEKMATTSNTVRAWEKNWLPQKAPGAAHMFELARLAGKMREEFEVDRPKDPAKALVYRTHLHLKKWPIEEVRKQHWRLMKEEDAPSDA